MKPTTLRTIVAIGVIVPCVVMFILEGCMSNFEVPWARLVLYFIALASRTFLIKPPDAVPPDPHAERQARDMFEDVRKRVIDWVKVQGLLVFIFAGTVGFYVVQETVRTRVDTAIEKELARVREGVGELRDTVKDATKDAIIAADDATEIANWAGVAVDEAVAEVDAAVLAAGEAADRAAEAALEAERDTDAAVADARDKINRAITESQQKLAQLTSEFDGVDASLALLTSKVDAVDARFAEVTEDIADVQQASQVSADLAVQAIAGGKTTNELIELLQKPEASWQEKLAAIETLAEMGPEAKAAVPAILNALKDENERVRAAAAAALGRIAWADQTVVLALAEALQDKDEDVRRSAAESLHDCWPKPRGVVPALIDALDDSVSGVIFHVVRTLVDMAGDAPDILPEFLEVVQDSTIEGRAGWVYVLAGLGPQGAEAVPVLLPILRGAPDNDLRAAVAIALGGIAAREAVTDLVRIVHGTTEEHLRIVCVSSLGMIGGDTAVAALREVLEDHENSPELRLIAVWALGRAGDDSYVRHLVHLMPNRTDRGPHHAAFRQALAGLGPADAAAGPDLLTVLKRALEAQMDGMADVAIDALARIRYVPARLTIQEIALQASGFRQERMLIAVAMIEGDPVNVLRDALRSDDRAIRHHAVNELGKFGREAEAAVPELIGVLEEDDLTLVRLQALQALTEIATPADRIIAALERASLNDPSGLVREQARWAVRMLRAPSGDID